MLVSLPLMGGGNSLNIIRIPSKKQWVNIVKSDMSGTVDISSIANRVSRWNYFSDGYYKITDYTTTQNNINDNCYSGMWTTNATQYGDLVFYYTSKNNTIGSIETRYEGNYHYKNSFRPIIECR